LTFICHKAGQAVCYLYRWCRKFETYFKGEVSQCVCTHVMTKSRVMLLRKLVVPVEGTLNGECV
jgi:hypothetical protein